MVLLFRQYSIDGRSSIDWLRLAGRNRSRTAIPEKELCPFCITVEVMPSTPVIKPAARGAVGIASIAANTAAGANRCLMGALLEDPSSGGNVPVHGSGSRVPEAGDRKSTRLNSSHSQISYAVFCL